MRHRILRNRSVVYLTLGVLIGAGGSYALAAGGSRPITVCADKTTGVLHLKTHGRCKADQARVSWNQQGPRGPQGNPGTNGSPGQAPPSAWGLVTSNGTPAVGATHGISVTHVSPGTYQVSVTAPACAGKQNVPVVTVNDANPPGGQSVGAFAVAWATGTAFGLPLTVYTGDVVSGAFTPSDHVFFIQDVCGT